MCDLNMNGGADNPITNAELSLDDAKRMFSPEFIKQLNVMYMCGNLGDPIVARDTLEIFEYFREHNQHVAKHEYKCRSKRYLLVGKTCRSNRSLEVQ